MRLVTITTSRIMRAGLFKSTPLQYDGFVRMYYSDGASFVSQLKVSSSGTVATTKNDKRAAYKKSRKGETVDHINVVPFAERVSMFTKKFETAIQHMIEMNPGFTVERSPDGLDMTVQLGVNDSVGGGDLGQVSLSAKLDDEVLNAHLPRSGLCNYSFDTTKGRWVSSADDHDLEGMIVRDMLRQCQGCPNF